jgi:LuxR family transcriptional regulator, quorum-sensing system regulator BjaR1
MRGPDVTEAAEYGRDALDFIERLERLPTVSAAMTEMERAFSRFGFETLILTGLPNPEQRFEQVVMAKRWPAEWFKIYTKKQYIRVDPVARLCRRSVHPFEWADAPYDAEQDPRAAEVMRRAQDFRMTRGFIVPIHGITGYEACISVGGTDLDLNSRSKPAIHLMAMYGFDRVRRLLAPTCTTVHRLTSRERDVLAWSAAGKSAWEIGAILRITQRTVEEHLANSRRKLGAANRTHAVAIAIRNRIIEP